MASASCRCQCGENDCRRIWLVASLEEAVFVSGQHTPCSLQAQAPTCPIIVFEPHMQEESHRVYFTR